jgi:hypothetical protein
MAALSHANQDPDVASFDVDFHGLINSSLLAVSLRKDKALEE